MTTPQTTPTRDEAVPTGWRYSINYGPDGEENFANVYAADGQFVGNLRTHHAIAICNAFAVCEKLASAPAPASGRMDAVAAIAKIIDPEGFKLLAEGKNLTTGQAANYRDAYGKAHLILASLSPAATPVSEADMRAFGASEMAAYKWPDDTPEHRAARAAFCEGAALAKPSSPAGGDVVREALEKVRRWAESRCPCHNEEPNPCPLCGASVENLEACKSAENTLPRELLTTIRAALSQSTSAGRGWGPAGTIIFNPKTNQRAVIDENTVLSAIKDDVVIVEPRRALDEATHDR